MAKLRLPLHAHQAASRGAVILCFLPLPAGAGCPLRLSGAAPDVRFGTACALPGDLNGDGAPDFVVGAAAEDAAGDIVPGRVAVYFGGAAADHVPDVVLNGQVNGDRFGFAVAGPGDLNGDGFADLAVGAYGFDTTLPDAGRVYIYYGGPGFDATPDAGLDGLSAGGWFGYSVAGPGDVNGNGAPDLMVGAPQQQSTQVLGAFYVFYGGPQWNAGADLTRNGTTGEALGYKVAGGGDVNGDGRADFLVSSRRPDLTGRVYVFFGGPTVDAVPDQTLFSDFSGSRFGDAIAGGDVTGDGISDVIVGAPLRDGAKGRVLVYFGSPAFDRIVDRVFDGTSGEQLGSAVGVGADWNQDGSADLFLGGPQALGGAGRVLVQYGGPTFDAVTDAVLDCSALAGQFGAAIAASSSDANGDGRDDVLFGAPLFGAPLDGNAGPGVGRASLDLGCVDVTCPAAGIASPGTSVPLQFSIRNPGSQAGDFQWTLDDPRGFCVPTQGTVSLGPGASAPVHVTCTIPAGEPCSEFGLSFAVQMQDCAENLTTCTTRYAVGIAPPKLTCPPPAIVNSGETLSFHYCMRNPNPGPTSFAYTLRPGPYGPVLSGVVTLAAGDSVCFDPTWFHPSIDECSVSTASFQANPVGCPGVSCDPAIFVRGRPIDETCAADTTVEAGDTVRRRFCFTGHVVYDYYPPLHYSIQDDLGWCTPVSGVIYNTPQPHCFDVECTVPDTLTVAAQSTIVLSVAPLEWCFWDVSTCTSHLQGIPGTVPVVVADWNAVRQADGVAVSWRLAGSSRSEIERVGLERAGNADGPYTRLSTHDPEARMTAVDADAPADRICWYRLVFEAGGQVIGTAGPFRVEARDGAVRTALLAVREESRGVRIEYAVGSGAAPVVVDVFDLAGRRVATLRAVAPAAGRHELVWDRTAGAGRTPRGLFLVRLRAAGVEDVRKIVLVKP